MPRHSPSNTLKRVLDIRVIQRRAAEAEVAKAAKELRALEDLQDDNRARCNAAEAQWRGAMTSSSMALHLVGSLSAAVLAEEAGIRQTEADISEAENKKADDSRLWRAALANEDAADSLTRAARRAETRRREEAVVSEMADRFSHRGAVR